MTVEKSGSMWSGQVTAINAAGDVTTEFKSAEVAPLAQNSKMWVEFRQGAPTVRGLSVDRGAAEVGKLIAIAGANGFIEIVVNQGSAAKTAQLSVGDRVVIRFRA